MNEKWKQRIKNVDIKKMKELSSELNIDPVIAYYLAGKGMHKEEIEKWMNPSLTELRDPYLLKDVAKAAVKIIEHISNKNKIMIANDYDCDGISAGYILYKGLSDIGANVYISTPDRVKDGYGLNTHMVEHAADNKTALIITCDNGIAAFEAAREAAKQKIDLIITDHHEVPFTREAEKYVEHIPKAFAVVNPKQSECKYPFKEICGAVVALKLIQVVYDVYNKTHIRKKELCMNEYLEIAALATVADIMPLVDENRVLVKFGLKEMEHTKNIGLIELLRCTQLTGKELTPYHIGFVLGPCLNAAGRLTSAEEALLLLNCKDKNNAAFLAERLVELNEKRKKMTEEGFERAKKIVEESFLNKKVFILTIPDCHESLAGIIAGRIKEFYHRPTVILTKTENGLKGSGRSIEGYDMFAEFSKYKHLFEHFGGHAAACGLSLKEENLKIFSEAVENDCSLTAEQLTKPVFLDVQVATWYLTEKLISDVEKLGPFGTGNQKPVFFQMNLRIERVKIIGKNKNVLRFTLREKNNTEITAVSFNLTMFEEKVVKRYGKDVLNDIYMGKNKDVYLTIAYEPTVNEWKGTKTIEVVIKNLLVQ